jgi:glycosyltransferase involved in cell wall biosynthesis
LQFCPGPKPAARARVGLPSDVPVILYVGNLVPVKGVDVLLRAAAQLAEGGRDFRLVLIGDGPLRPALERQVRESGLGERVRFAGSIAHGELPDWFRAADVFCLPSHSEGVPTVLLEASACGTPWVASAVGGIPEIAALGPSRLVLPDSPADLAAALKSALNEPVTSFPPGPRDRRESVAEVVDFLALTIDRAKASSQPNGLTAARG